MSQRTTTIFAPSQTLALLLGLTTALLPTALFAAEIELDLRTGRYASSDTGVVSALKLTGDDKTPEASGVSFGLTLTTGETLSPTSIRRGSPRGILCTRLVDGFSNQRGPRIRTTRIDRIPIARKSRRTAPLPNRTTRNGSRRTRLECWLH